MKTLPQFLVGLAVTASLSQPLFARPSQSGLELSNLDKTANPAENFYQYANGGWMQSNPIPSDKPRWGTFNALADRNQDALKTILDKCQAEGGAPGSLERKLGDFYRSGMDEAALSAAGLKPLADDVAAIQAIQSLADVQKVATSMQRRGLHPFFVYGSSQDYKDSSKVVGSISQGGLGLPEKDYYFRKDEKSQEQRTKYVAKIGEALASMGGDASQAPAVMAFETELAQASLGNVEMREPENTYHLVPLGKLGDYKNWQWAAFFSDMGGPAMSDLNLATPKFFDGLDAALARKDVPVLKSYLLWVLWRESAPYLSEAIYLQHFDFYSKTLQDIKAPTPRWRRVTKVIDTTMGEALGQKYVETNFPPAAKARVKEMVENLQAVLGDDIRALTWMGPETKQAALKKLSTFHAKIGYPDRWRDYSKLTVGDKSYLANVWAAQAFETQRDLDKIGKPVDHNEWFMTPPTVNAYYDSQSNEIVFPAGIMQPPFFSVDYDDSLNYGGIGTVIGHEITHGFDDQGSKFDEVGNLRNWWTASDLANFTKIASGVQQQFSGYEVKPGLHINGKLVLGESLADLGGLKLSYQAYQRHLKTHPSKVMDGYTPEQRFFLGYARIWAMNMREAYERLQVNTDPHPHPRYRVNGPLSNMVEFAKAFQVPPGSPMVRQEIYQLW